MGISRTHEVHITLFVFAWFCRLNFQSSWFFFSSSDNIEIEKISQQNKAVCLYGLGKN